MTYENLSQILADVVDFIKTFTAGLKAFINGFKTEYYYGEEEETAAAED